MKFLLDENFPRKAAALLVERGHIVVDSRDLGLSGSDDTTLFDRAQNSGSILLTTDKDFFHTVPQLYENHYGAVVIALAKPNGPAIIERLKTFLAFVRNLDLTNNAVLLTDDKMYAHRLTR